MNNSYESRTRRIRRALARKGWALRMSPTKNRQMPDWGKFRIIDLETNSVVHGKAFELDLDAVEAFVFG